MPQRDPVCIRKVKGWIVSEKYGFGTEKYDESRRAIRSFKTVISILMETVRGFLKEKLRRY